MDSDVFAYLLRYAADQKEMIEQALAAGNAANYESYCKLVGGYAVLVDMEATIKELEQRYLAA